MEGGERDAERELRMHALRKLGDEVEDAFSGASALQRFGIAETLGKMQLEVMKGVEENTAKIVEEVRELMRLFRLR